MPESDFQRQLRELHAQFLHERFREGLAGVGVDEGVNQIQFGPTDSNREYRPPTRSHSDDAGWDLYCSEQVVIPPGQFRDLPTSVWVAVPEGVWGLVTGRSSALRKHGLLVHSGVIDAGYRGELYAGAFNLSAEQVVVQVGDRLAQYIPIGIPDLTMAWVDGDPPPGSRGSAGFGSTGR